eukprot:133991_1
MIQKDAIHNYKLTSIIMQQPSRCRPQNESQINYYNLTPKRTLNTSTHTLLHHTNPFGLIGAGAIFPAFFASSALFCCGAFNICCCCICCANNCCNNCVGFALFTATFCVVTPLNCHTMHSDTSVTWVVMLAAVAIVRCRQRTQCRIRWCNL